MVLLDFGTAHRSWELSADTARQSAAADRAPGMTDRHLEIDGSDVLARPAAETKLEILSTKFEGAGDHVCGDGGPEGQRPAAVAIPAPRRGAILLRTKPILMITSELRKHKRLLALRRILGGNRDLTRVRTKPFLEGRVDSEIGACSAYNAVGRTAGRGGGTLLEGLGDAGDGAGTGGITSGDPD